MAWVFCVFCGTTVKNTMAPSSNNLHLLTDEQWCEGTIEDNDAQLVWKCFSCAAYLIDGEWHISESKLKLLKPGWKPEVKPPCSNCGSTSHGHCNKGLKSRPGFRP